MSSKDSIDKLIILDLKDGCEHAFSLVFNMFKNDIYSYALSLVKNPEYAKEVVQDVFLKLWQTKERICLESDFKSYLFKIAKNTVFDLLRKAANDYKLREEVYYFSNQIETNTSESNSEHLSIEIVKKVCKSLPEKRKAIFEMSKFQGKTHSEIALELNISQQTVKNQIHLAIQQIRSLVKKMNLTVFIFILLKVIKF